MSAMYLLYSLRTEILLTAITEESMGISILKYNAISGEMPTTISVNVVWAIRCA